MCCNYKDGPVVALALLRDKYGINIPQAEWHDLRHAAELRLKAEGLLDADAKLTNARADAALVAKVAGRFADTLGLDEVARVEFITALRESRPTVRNAHTIDEVSTKLEAGERVGVIARQPVNGKNVTFHDMVERAGGYDKMTRAQRQADFEESGREPVTVRKLRPGVSLAQVLASVSPLAVTRTTWAAAPDEGTPARPLFDALAADVNRDQVTLTASAPEGLVFDVGRDTVGGRTVSMQVTGEDQVEVHVAVKTRRFGRDWFRDIESVTTMTFSQARAQLVELAHDAQAA